MGRKRFAKNTEGVRHFRLVSRSQTDADAKDPNSTPLVLEACVKPGDKRRTGLSEAELLAIPESLQTLGPEVFGLNRGVDVGSDDDEVSLGSEELAEEDLDGDCYFPRDGYNYEQHLKRVSGVGKGGGVVGVVLPAPQAPDLKEIRAQPVETTDQYEVMRALEEPDIYEELGDDDLDMLLPSGVVEDVDMLLFGPTAAENRALPDVAAFKMAHKQAIGAVEFLDDDVDDCDVEGAPAERQNVNFEEFLAGEYGEEEIGAIDEEDIEGYLTVEACEAAADEYLQAKSADQDQLNSINEPIKGKYDDVPRVIDETRAIIEKYYSAVDSDDETSPGEEDTDESRLWDCESVLSTLSNLSNRPGKIGKIKLIAKPKKELPRLAEEAEDDVSEEGADGNDASSVIELPDVITERKRGETPEERRARKASVKEMRRVCRKMKKESKEMYKNEAAKLPANQATSDVKSGLRYQRL